MNFRRKGASNAGQVTGSLLSDVAPILPAVLEWLRDKDILNAAKKFEKAAMFLAKKSNELKINDSEVNDAVLHLASSLDKGPLSRARKKRGKKANFPNNVDLNLVLLEPKEDLVWFIVILRVLSESAPALIPAGLAMLPVATRSELSPTDVGKMNSLKSWIDDNFSFLGLQVFGDFCSLLRDSLSLAGMSDRLSFIVTSFAGLVVEGKSDLPSARAEKASNILQICIKQCYRLFDLPQKNANWAVKGCRIAVRPKDRQARFEQLSRDLETFFELKDSSLIPAVPLFMKSYNVYQIALGILIKFGCLPLGWKSILEEGAKAKNKDAVWFNPKKITFLSEGTVTLAAAKGIPKYYVPSKANQIYRELKKKNEDDLLGRVVAEFIENKRDYLSNLELFLDEFIAEITFIATSPDFGTDAKNALGISKIEIEQMTGKPLQDVAKFEKKLVSELQVLNLCPAPVQQKVGRAGVLCRIICKHSEEMINVYTAYNRHYEQASRLLDSLTPTGANNRNGGDNGIDLHFLDIYNELRYPKKQQAVSIDGALSAPVNYLPKLPLYFDRVRKYYEKNKQKSNPAYELVQDTLKRIRIVLEEVNAGLASKKYTPNNSEKNNTGRSTGRSTRGFGLLKHQTGKSSIFKINRTPMKRSKLGRGGSNLPSALSASVGSSLRKGN